MNPVNGRVVLQPPPPPPWDVGLPPGAADALQWMAWHHFHGRLGPLCPYPKPPGWNPNMAVMPRFEPPPPGPPPFDPAAP